MNKVIDLKVFAERLTTLLDNSDETTYTLADKLGLTSATISRYANALMKPKVPTVISMAKIFNVNEAWLMGYDVPMEQEVIESNAEILNERLFNIPVFESASAGFGVTAQSNIIDYIPLPFRSKSEAENTLCIRVKGDSMSPKIEDGDLIQVYRQTSVDSGDVAVVIVDNDEGFVKKVEYDTDFIRLISFNPYYPPIVFNGADVLRVNVVGKVKKIIREM